MQLLRSDTKHFARAGSTTTAGSASRVRRCRILCKLSHPPRGILCRGRVPRMGRRRLGRIRVRRGEIRWYTFREPDERRPVLLLTRNDVIEKLNEILVVPIFVPRDAEYNEVSCAWRMENYPSPTNTGFGRPKPCPGKTPAKDFHQDPPVYFAPRTRNLAELGIAWHSS